MHIETNSKCRYWTSTNTIFQDSSSTTERSQNILFKKAIKPRAYSGGLKAMPPVESKGKASVQGVIETKHPEGEAI